MDTPHPKAKATASDPENISNLQNMTEKSVQDEKLSETDHYLLLTLLDNVPEHIYFKDTESRFIRISKSLAKTFGLKYPSDAIGKTDFDFFTSEHARAAFEDEQEIIRTGKTLSLEENETWSDHPDSWVLTTKMPMYDDQGKIIGTFGISRDITNRKIAEDNLRLQAALLQEKIEEISLLRDEVKDQATHDPLTGLSNRRSMDTVLPQKLELCKQLKQTFSILIIDIDHFKNINDNFGHPFGDTVLEKLAKSILDSTRDGDFCCRFGGDEFLIAFQKMSTQNTVKKAEFIRQKFGSILLLKDDQRISTTISIGIATYPADGNSINELINKADKALYQAKEKGRNQIVLAS